MVIGTLLSSTVAIGGWVAGAGWVTMTVWTTVAGAAGVQAVSTKTATSTVDRTNKAFLYIDSPLLLSEWNRNEVFNLRKYLRIYLLPVLSSFWRFVRSYRALTFDCPAARGPCGILVGLSSGILGSIQTQKPCDVRVSIKANVHTNTELHRQTCIHLWFGRF